MTWCMEVAGKEEEAHQYFFKCVVRRAQDTADHRAAETGAHTSFMISSYVTMMIARSIFSSENRQTMRNDTARRNPSTWSCPVTRAFCAIIPTWSCPVTRGFCAIIPT